MGQIFVEGLGIVEIEGGVPTAAESSAIAGGAPQQSPLEELTGGVIGRGTFEAVGGMGGAILGGGAGAVAGAPTGPGAVPAAVAGGIAGGALGSAAGSAAFDQVNNFLLMLGLGEGEMKTATEAMEGAVRSAVGDAEFSMAFTALGPLANVVRGGRPLIGRILGIANPAAAQIAGRASRFGIDLGITDVSPRAFIQGAPRVLGVIPIIGSPLRKASGKKAGQIVFAGEDLINQIAPLGLLSDLGTDLTKAAGANFKAARGRIGDAWDLFRELAETASNKDIFPTGNIRENVDELIRIAEEAKIVSRTQETIGGAVSRTADLDTWIRSLRDLPEHISIKQIRGLSEDAVKFADAAANRGSASDLRTLGNIKRTIEADIQNINTSLIPEDEANQLVGALQTANRTTARELAPFETATAKKLGTFDRRIFKPGPFKAGSKEADELASTFVNLNTKKAVQNLRNVAGDDVVNRLARQRIQDAFDKSFTSITKDSAETLFNPFAFEKNLGLARKAKGQLNRETLTELLETSGITIREIEDFTAAAKDAIKVEIGSASSFVARKFILTAGGAGVGVAAAGIATLGLQNGISAAAVMLALVGRFGAKFLASKNQLRMMTAILSDTLPDRNKRQLLGRLIRAGVFKDEPDVTPAAQPPSQPVAAPDNGGELPVSPPPISEETILNAPFP